MQILFTIRASTNINLPLICCFSRVCYHKFVIRLIIKSGSNFAFKISSCVMISIAINVRIALIRSVLRYLLH